MIRIYGTPRSRATRCMWLLEEMGVPYELVRVDTAAGANRQPAFLALNPAGKVPILELESFVMSESHAINLWLAQREGGSFWPADPHERGRILQWTFWTAAELEPVTSQILRLKRAGEPGAEARIAELLVSANALIQLVELQLGKGRFLAGDEFGLADIAVGSVLVYADFFGIDMAAFPRTGEWLNSLRRRPGHQRVFGAA
ncbi:MAG TPA: glutathione S-transferase family protein [Rhizomicrobium sp.]|nr:glutathione S-transferase family protein [Rhizomicrobium sp.]